MNKPIHLTATILLLAASNLSAATRYRAPLPARRAAALNSAPSIRNST
jgi:hypothetical protein